MVDSIKSGGHREAQLLQRWVNSTSASRASPVVENTRARLKCTWRIPRGGEGCTTCFDAGKEMGQVYGTVYIRSRGDSAGQDELF